MKIFFIGIKGSGMSSLASMLKDLNNEISGSDVDTIFFTDKILKEKKIKITNFDVENISQDIELVILGNAFSEDHPQVLEAKRKNIKVIRYYDYINLFGKNKTNIAISGTNGKTTTTSLAVSMFGSDFPNYIIGDGHGAGNINSDYFIFEACEYKRTFLNYNPEITIINNIEMDHPDYFKDVNDVIAAFYELALKSKTLIANLDDLHSKTLINQLNNKNIEILTFSLNNSDADLYLQNISENEAGYTFDLFYQNQEYQKISLPFYGIHMLQNSLASILCGLKLNLNLDYIITNLKKFKGAKRRFEKYILSSEKNVILIDDYAHHPTSIELVIKAIRQNYPNHELNIAFQPHTFSRTIEFLDEFCEVLSKADRLYLEPVFGSIRESSDNKDIYILNKHFEKTFPNKLYNDIYQIIDTDKENQIFLLLGAGDLDKKYIKEIQKMY